MILGTIFEELPKSIVDDHIWNYIKLVYTRGLTASLRNVPVTPTSLLSDNILIKVSHGVLFIVSYGGWP